jgi:hypothetical protein
LDISTFGFSSNGSFEQSSTLELNTDYLSVIICCNSGGSVIRIRDMTVNFNAVVTLEFTGGSQDYIYDVVSMIYRYKYGNIAGLRVHSH